MRVRQTMLLFLIIGFCIPSIYAQLRMKRVCYLPTGPHDELTNIICYDSDHNGLNEIIFERIIATYISAWMVLEHRPMNRYELVFADTSSGYPYPPGITTGNFRPYDVGDIDRDSLTDLVGPNKDQPSHPDTLHYVVTTQESPNYSFYPASLTWWYRHSNNFLGDAGAPYYFPPDLDSDSINEILLTAPSPLGVAIFENIANNQNVVVWNRIEGIAAFSFTFGDFDLDGRKEFVTAWLGSLGRVFIFENTGNNQYELIRVDTVYLPNGLDVFSGQDLDGDGRPEFFVAFAVVPTNTFYLYMWEATGNNTYQRTLIDQKVVGFTIRSTGRRSKCGDIDGDGIEELVWATPTRLYVYKATGNNQFQQVWEWWQDHGTHECLIVNIYDMNNNGYKEIVVGGSGKTSIFEVEAVRLIRPNGGETFQYNTQQLIRWQTFNPPRCDSLSIFYSINNGQSYLPLTSGISGSDTSYLWTVPNVNSDSCKVKVIAYGPGWQYDESDGTFSITTTGIEENSMFQVLRFTLQVLPNPAKTLTAIRYSLPAESKVSLILYNISGRLVKTLVDEHKKPGNYSLTLNTKTLSSGVYFLSLQTQEKRIIKRLVIVK